MTALAVEGLEVRAVGEAELDEQVVRYVQVLKKRGVGKADVGKTVLVDGNLLEILTAVEVNCRDLVAAGVKVGESRTVGDAE